MLEVNLSDAARADLMDIAFYTEEKWGVQQQRRYLDEINRVLESLATGNRRGKSCSDIRAGLMAIRSQKHFLFYRAVNDRELIVVRILHQSMDFERHL